MQEIWEKTKEKYHTEPVDAGGDAAQPEEGHDGEDDARDDQRGVVLPAAVVAVLGAVVLGNVVCVQAHLGRFWFTFDASALVYEC